MIFALGDTEIRDIIQKIIDIYNFSKNKKLNPVYIIV